MNFYKLVLIHFNVVDWSECRLGNAQVAKILFYSTFVYGSAGLLVD